MKNVHKSLELLRQLRDSLKSNQGVPAEQHEKVLATLNHVIEVLERNKASEKLITVDKLLVLIDKVFKVFPSIIDLINKHWH